MMRIVLIEDDPFTREDILQELREAGYDVASHSGGRKALQAILSDPPNLVITDIIMEDGEGIDVITIIKERRKDVAVIAISSNRDYLKYAALLGADRTIQKPIKPKSLLEEIERMRV